MAGSERLFHEVTLTFSPVTWLVLIIIFGVKVLEGCLKLSHIVLPVMLSSKTRFPVFRSWAVELDSMFETFDDQTTCFLPFSTTRFLSSDMVTTDNP